MVDRTRSSRCVKAEASFALEKTPNPLVVSALQNPGALSEGTIFVSPSQTAIPCVALMYQVLWLWPPITGSFKSFHVQVVDLSFPSNVTRSTVDEAAWDTA